VFGLVVCVLLPLHLCLNTTGLPCIALRQLRDQQRHCFECKYRSSRFMVEKGGGGAKCAVISVSGGGGGGRGITACSSRKRELVTLRRHSYELVLSNDSNMLRSEAKRTSPGPFSHYPRTVNSSMGLYGNCAGETVMTRRASGLGLMALTRGC